MTSRRGQHHGHPVHMQATRARTQPCRLMYNSTNGPPTDCSHHGIVRKSTPSSRMSKRSMRSPGPLRGGCIIEGGLVCVLQHVSLVPLGMLLRRHSLLHRVLVLVYCSSATVPGCYTAIVQLDRLFCMPSDAIKEREFRGERSCCRISYSYKFCRINTLGLLTRNQRSSSLPSSLRAVNHTKLPRERA